MVVEREPNIPSLGFIGYKSRLYMRATNIGDDPLQVAVFKRTTLWWQCKKIAKTWFFEAGQLILRQS